MKKLYVQNLMLIITSKCNFNCRHCLRGNGYTINMSKHMLDEVFKEIKYVDNLIISGGEPLLAKNELIDLLEVLKHQNVSIEQYGFATNGTLYDEEIEIILDQYEEYAKNVSKNRCSRINPKMHGYIDLSDDDFHHEELVKIANPKYQENIEKLKNSKYFFGVKHLNNGIETSGNALDLVGEDYKLVPPRNYKMYNYQDKELNYLGPVVTIAPNGKIINCNSYDEMEFSNFGLVDDGIFEQVKKNSKKCLTYKGFIKHIDKEVVRQKYKR